MRKEEEEEDIKYTSGSGLLRVFGIKNEMLEANFKAKIINRHFGVILLYKKIKRGLFIEEKKHGKQSLKW